MSTNNTLPEDESSLEEADRIVRAILDNDHQTAAEISPSGELYRAIARFNRNLRNGVNEPGTLLNPQNPGRSDELRNRFQNARRTMEQNRERRRLRSQEAQQLLQESQSSNTPPSIPAQGTPPIAVGSYPSSPRRSRPPPSRRQVPSTSPDTSDQRPTFRSLEEIRTRANDENPPSNHTLLRMADLYVAGQQLEYESSRLRSILDAPLLNVSSTRDMVQEYEDEAQTIRAFKRRRLETTSAPNFKGFSYGHYGQVEAGKLQMEIESCDGGMYEYEDPEFDYAASNVLKNDDSVYCTKGNRCNLVLRHQGATPFCLQELIIKAPRKGFTAPVQEGMVFVSMDSDDLLTRTANYLIQYSPIRRNTSTGRPVISVRHNPDGSNVSTYDLAPTPPERSYRLAQIPSEFQTPTSQPFEVTTSCSDDEEESQASPRLRRMRGRRIAPHRIGEPRQIELDTSSSEDEEDQERHLGNLGRHMDDILNYPNRTPSPTIIDPANRRTGNTTEAGEASTSNQDATQEGNGELMAPHARFFIEQGKSKCTIKFDPPVSGRFVLLKMWSPKHRPGGNIDIQSVTVKGFAGPRFFPAIELM